MSETKYTTVNGLCIKSGVTCLNILNVISTSGQKKNNSNAAIIVFDSQRSDFSLSGIGILNSTQRKNK